MNLPKSIDQLVAEIKAATRHVPPPSLFLGNAKTEQTGISCLDEEQLPTYLSLEDWSGIKKDQLPLDSSLTEKQIQSLLSTIKNLLAAYNCAVIFQKNIPERIQYRVIRERFNQKVPIQQDDYFSFSLCDQQTARKDCVMGTNHCHCVLMDNFFEKYSTKEVKELEEIDEFREYILEKRFGSNWREQLGLNGEYK